MTRWILPFLITQSEKKKLNICCQIVKGQIFDGNLGLILSQVRWSHSDVIFEFSLLHSKPNYWV